MGKRDRNLYYGKKLLLFLGSVFLLSVVVFYVARLAPGDPLVSYYGDRTEKMSPAEREWAMEKLGLNEPIYVQYVKWLENAVHGNFGISFKYKQDVIKVISQRMTNTLLLGGIGFLIIFAGSLLLGIFCAWNEEKWIDKILCRLGTISSCIPEFWISLVLILIFSVTLRILPSSGAYSTGKAADIPDRILHLILPLTVVSLEHLWYYAYMVRNKIQEEVRADYVLLAKSKGLGKKGILFGHCLRNVMPSYLSIMAIAVPHVLGGTFVVESVFSYPGIGALSYESARYHDYNLLMILCMISGILVIFCNMLSQIINEHIDPRIRAREITDTSEVTDETANDSFQIVGQCPAPERTARLPKKWFQGKPLISIMILAAIILGCLCAELIMTKDPTYMDLQNYNQAPNREFLFGTDTMGRDIFSMLWYGGRISLTIGVLSTFISTFLAIVIGSFCGIAPQWLDSLLMRFTEIFLSIPSLLLIILFQAVLGKANVFSLSVVIGLTSWTSIAKVVRTEVRQIRNNEYVIASRCMGGNFFHILWKHLTPNFLPSIMFMVVMNIRSAIISESTFSFMGIGLPLEIISWGSMLSLAEKALLTSSWWIILIPGIFLITTLLCMTNIGNYLRRSGNQKESNL